MAACFACSDTLIKYLGAFVPVLLLMWGRYAFQAVSMALWLARLGPAGFKCAHPRSRIACGSFIGSVSPGEIGRAHV